ncbi:MAG TPA: hypothetical protein VFI80_04810, partial [Burkholderiales bacterium]|nr:hypothetical protein [Burkholderiales bacterium]
MSTVAAGHSLAQAFAAAAEALGRILLGTSLNDALADLKRRPSPGTLVAAAQDLAYNALRSYGVVDVALDRLLQKPLADIPVRGLLLAALAELVANGRLCVGFDSFEGLPPAQEIDGAAARSW